jgi:hypothetical protein
MASMAAPSGLNPTSDTVRVVRNQSRPHRATGEDPSRGPYPFLQTAPLPSARRELRPPNQTTPCVSDTQQLGSSGYCLDAKQSLWLRPPRPM